VSHLSSLLVGVLKLC